MSEPKVVILLVLVALLVSALCWYLGADVWRSLLLGCAITAAAVAALDGLALALSPEGGDTPWRGDPSARQRGARSDVASLAASLNDRFGRSSLARGRLRQIARHRLALQGLDLARPADRVAIEQLIGRRAYRVLAHEHRRGLALRSLLHGLDALEALDPAGGATPPRATSPRPYRAQASTGPGRARER